MSPWLTSGIPAVPEVGEAAQRTIRGGPDAGFLGGVVLISLYAFLSIWAVHIASQSKDRFGAAVAIGVGAMVFWHAVCNIGMATGVLPVVGITLPLFSYGGSSIVTMMIGLGLLMNVSMRR